MEHDIEGFVLDCAIAVTGPRNNPNEVGAVLLAVRQALKDEEPLALPDDAERLAGSLSTHLRLAGIARAGDVLVPELTRLISLYDAPIPPFRRRIGIGLAPAEIELLLSLLQNKVLEIDAWALEKDCFNKSVDAAERELLVSLKNIVAEGKSRYLKG